MATALATVPPADVGTPGWESSRGALLDAYRHQFERAAAIDAGLRPPFSAEARRVHGLPDGAPYPPAWKDDPADRATTHLLELYDRADLRALGFCRTCGQPMTLRQIGRCVYGEPCGHYRVQGELTVMRHFLTTSLEKITPERRASLLALIGR